MQKLCDGAPGFVSSILSRSWSRVLTSSAQSSATCCGLLVLATSKELQLHQNAQSCSKGGVKYCVWYPQLDLEPRGPKHHSDACLIITVIGKFFYYCNCMLIREKIDTLSENLCRITVSVWGDFPERKHYY